MHNSYCFSTVTDPIGTVFRTFIGTTVTMSAVNGRTDTGFLSTYTQLLLFSHSYGHNSYSFSTISGTITMKKHNLIRLFDSTPYTFECI